jgi:predicted kinase
MPTLIITRGLPASGKTTRAREWVDTDPAGRARVNRDDLRRMLQGRRLGTAVQEAQVSAAQHAAVAALLVAGVNVVADDTNLPDSVVAAWAELAARCGAVLAVWDLRNVPVEVCVARDAARVGDARVGERVIRGMDAVQGRVRVTRSE